MFDVDQKSDDEDTQSGQMSEAEVDLNLMESFPASDPPSWTVGIGVHRKPHEEIETEEISDDSDADDPK